MTLSRKPLVLVVLAAFLGACASAPPPEAPPAPTEEAAPAPAGSFAGIWKTTYGTMRLAVAGDHVTGTYSYGDGATLDGTLEGGQARLTYREADGTVGRALFELRNDGRRFNGVWQPGAEGPALALHTGHFERWQGERIEAVKDRVWLVILEANWEEGLYEQEYSYGTMLRAFFERLPNVAVRHRFIHDRKDLLRYCREAGELPEPVILYISSHGSEKGVATGTEEVDGATLGKVLAGIGELKLLHLGACSVLRGDFGDAVRSASAPHAPFPISGYRRDADWAGSAIVDFTYLDLILEHGMSPEDAAKETERTIHFAGSKDGRNDPIPAMDFTILPASSAPQK